MSVGDHGISEVLYNTSRAHRASQPAGQNLMTQCIAYLDTLPVVTRRARSTLDSVSLFVLVSFKILDNEIQYMMFNHICCI